MNAGCRAAHLGGLLAADCGYRQQANAHSHSRGHGTRGVEEVRRPCLRRPRVRRSTASLDGARRPQCARGPASLWQERERLRGRARTAHRHVPSQAVSKKRDSEGGRQGPRDLDPRDPRSGGPRRAPAGSGTDLRGRLFGQLLRGTPETLGASGDREGANGGCASAGTASSTSTCHATLTPSGTTGCCEGRAAGGRRQGARDGEAVPEEHG